MEELKIRLEILKERRQIFKDMYEIGTIDKQTFDKKLMDILEDMEEIKRRTYEA